MALTWDEACAAVTAPGSPLELEDGPDGNRVFAHPPANLRDAFALAREGGGGGATFLVFEDERWTARSSVADDGDERLRSWQAAGPTSSPAATDAGFPMHG